jgi:hypothetical protein
MGFNNNKIIAMGDLHGDYQVFINMLIMCDLVDDDIDWIGGNTYLIQLGDTLDGKRPDTVIDPSFLKVSGEIEIIELIIKLDAQAKRFGGRVISLIGNHELYPYYLKKDIKFVRDYVKSADVKKFKERFNMNRVEFLQPGRQGGVLFGRTRPLILQLGEFIFVHGSITDKLINHGLNKKTGKVDINKINKDTSNWLNGKGNVPKFLEEMDEENPVFSRHYSNSRTFNEEECNKFDKQLEFFDKANYVVMGHSRFKNINSACNNTLIRTDVSLSRAFGGDLASKSLQALEIIQRVGAKPVISIITVNGKVKLS